MNWLELHIDTVHGGLDTVEALLSSLDIDGVVIDDETDFQEFLEDRCFPRMRDNLKLILQDLELDFYDPFYIIEKTKGRMGEDMHWLKVTYLNLAST